MEFTYPGQRPQISSLSIILSCFTPFLLSVKDGVWKGGSNFWVCGQNAVLWPFKLYLSASTVTWHYLFFQHLQNGIWKFCRTLILTTSGSETVKEHWSIVRNNLTDVTHPLLEITRDKTRQERNPRTSYLFLVISAVWQSRFRPLSLISLFHTFFAWLLKRDSSDISGIPAALLVTRFQFSRLTRL